MSFESETDIDDDIFELACNYKLTGKYPKDCPQNKKRTIRRQAKSIILQNGEVWKERKMNGKTKIFMQMGLPNVLTTDNGSEFRNKLNAAMLKKLGIRHSFITPYHPQVQSNSAEYAFKTVMGHKEMWDEFIDSAYNTSTHESTTYSPFEVMFGKKARLPVEADLRPIPSNYDSRLAHAPNTSNQMAQVAKERQEILKDVKHNIFAAQAKQKQHYDAKHTRAKLFDVGVQVLKKDFLRSQSVLITIVASPFQSVHTQSLRSFLTPSLESVLIPTFQSAFALTPVSLRHSIPVSLHHSIPVSLYHSIPVNCQQLTPVSPYLRVLITFVKSDQFNYIFSFRMSIKHYSGACVLHYKAAEDDEEFDETSLKLKEGEYALSKDITVCLWLEYRSLNGSTPLRDVSGGDFVIVNEELHGEFDEFRSKVYAYVDKEYSIVEAVELLQVWCRATRNEMIKDPLELEEYLQMEIAFFGAFHSSSLDHKTTMKN
ncbi:hypothetical protein EMCRGX_G029199 [Ephydatia muelleri]